MKHLTEKKLILILVAVGILFYLQNDSESPNLAETGEPAETENSEFISKPLFREKVIYLCRLGDEQIPAVQISEVQDEEGRIIGTTAIVEAEPRIEIRARSAEPVWDYKSVSARSADSLIEVSFLPDGGREDFDWTLTLMDQNTFFRERVRDCLEVSDE